MPRAQAPRRGAVHQPRGDAAELVPLERRARRRLRPRVERGDQPAVAETRGDAREQRLPLERRARLGAPPHERAGQRAVADARAHALHDLAATRALVERRAPLHVEQHLQAGRGLRLDVAAESVEGGAPRRLSRPRAERARAALGASHQQHVRARVVGVCDGGPPLGEAVRQVLPGPRRERAARVGRLLGALGAQPVRVLLPVTEAVAQVLAVPEPQRVQLHDVVPRAPARERALQRVALPERDGDHPVLHRGFARRAQRAQRRRVSDPDSKRRRRELEVGVPALRGVLVAVGVVVRVVVKRNRPFFAVRTSACTPRAPAVSR